MNDPSIIERSVEKAHIWLNDVAAVGEVAVALDHVAGRHRDRLPGLATPITCRRRP